MDAFKNQLTLANSVAVIQELEKATAAKKKADCVETFTSSAPTALARLSEKNGDVSKLTKPEICSLLFSCYGTKIDEKKHLKPKLIEMLTDKIRGNPEAVAAAVAYLVAPVANEDLVATAVPAQIDHDVSEDLAATIEPVQTDPATNTTAPPVSSTQPVVDAEIP